MYFDRNFILDFWWFIFYEFHYFCIAGWLLFRLARLTNTVQNVRLIITKRVAKDELIYDGDSRSYASFLSYLNEERRGAKLFGLLCDNNLALKLLYVVIAISFSLINNQFK